MRLVNIKYFLLTEFEKAVLFLKVKPEAIQVIILCLLIK